MRAGIIVSVLFSYLLLQEGAANAQAWPNAPTSPFPQSVGMRCGERSGLILDVDRQSFPNIPSPTDRIDVIIYYGYWSDRSVHDNLVIDDAAIGRFLDTIRTGVHAYCEKVAATMPNWETERGAPGIPDSYVIQLSGLGYNDFLVAYSTSLSGGWTIINNGARAEVQRQRTFQNNVRTAQIRANQQAALVYRQKLAAQKRFYTQFGVSQWVQVGQLLANPFVFQNKTVGVHGRFIRMLSKADALFSSGSTFVVSNVPPTLFRGDEEVVLAVKVLGLRTDQGVSMPNLRFIGVHRCARDCYAEIWPG